MKISNKTIYIFIGMAISLAAYPFGSWLGKIMKWHLWLKILIIYFVLMAIILWAWNKYKWPKED